MAHWSKIRAALALLALVVAFIPLSALAGTEAVRRAEARADAPALAAAMHDLCGRKVALLGEAQHGDGRSVAFKSALVRRLVERCGFNAVYFEASHYEFLEISRMLRSHEAVPAARIATGVGWLWGHDEEVQPLLSFLAAEAAKGRVTLGGLDDQLGARDQPFANDRMPAELTSYLPPPARDDCRKRLHQRIYSDYPEGAPHAPADLAPLQACVANIRLALAAEPVAARRVLQLDMVENIQRFLARDFEDPPHGAGARDLSMYLNLRELHRRAPPRTKIIVWAASVHTARDVSAVRGFIAGRNLGAYVRDQFGADAFSLGFTAAGGTTRLMRHPVQTLPAAPPGSVEARALAGDAHDTIYLGPSTLAPMGETQSAAFSERYLTAAWSRVFDAVVVFRAERPARLVGP